jgi:hypothetical protein
MGMTRPSYQQLEVLMQILRVKGMTDFEGMICACTKNLVRGPKAKAGSPRFSKHFARLSFPKISA